MDKRKGYLVSVLAVVSATAVSWTALGQQQLADVVMVYLLGTVLVSMRCGYGPSVLAAILSVATFNFFFIPPYYTFAVADLRHVVTFVVMLTVALVISGLTRRVRDQARAAVAAAKERERLAEEAHAARTRIETEQLRNALLSSVSHDFRTPLAVVTGAASALLEGEVSPGVRRELTDTILHEADRLNRLLQNLLDMTRLESGTLRVSKQWQPIEEVIGSALNRAESVIGPRDVTTSLPGELTLVPLDSVLIEQVLVNLLENAAKHTPPGTPIHVGVRACAGAVEIEVADRGAGIRAGDESKVFEKFERGRAGEGGVGLGLTICRGIVLAHGGEIHAAGREGGGASFRFTLPLDGEPPRMALETAQGAAP